MVDIALAKAVLIPMVEGSIEPDESKYILVQFNPESLRISLSNTLKADAKAKPEDNAAQYVDKSESSLSVNLIFDTSVARDITIGNRSAKHAANSDVRLLTKAIASKFMQPQTSTDGLLAPMVCRFQWGAFAFVGMLSSFNETLDFFSPEGIPLRSNLALVFKENRYQFETIDVVAPQRAVANFTASNKGVSQTLAQNGKDPKQWRETALFNGIENPRAINNFNLAVPSKNEVSKGVAGRAKGGQEKLLGGQINGAFKSITNLADNAKPI
ncbi:MAG: hypothetical protein V7784_07755 [Oceanospirillaceae bacterium]